MDLQTISLIIPLVTTHIGGHGWNNDNSGLGVELSNYNNAITAVYLEENSIGEESLYLAYSRKAHYRGASLHYGLAAATGYSERRYDDHVEHGSDTLVFPVFGAEYKSLRIVTSYPASKIGCKGDAVCGDFVNLQYVHKF